MKSEFAHGTDATNANTSQLALCMFVCKSYSYIGSYVAICIMIYYLVCN